MSDVRWNCPFSKSFAYLLFNKHFTELNKQYWAVVPVSNTIVKYAKSELKKGTKPLDYFFVHNEDDRRIASDFNEWLHDFREFQNFNRLNFIMALSSCLEVYLRGIVSLALESKPASIFGDSTVLDGAKLLKSKINYSSFNKEKYPFYSQVLSISQGEWSNRLVAYEKLFEIAPLTLKNNISNLDAVRKLRNDIAHYLGRPKHIYETPLRLFPDESVRLSHERLILLFKTVFEVVNSIDSHLFKDWIGSYEILKLYHYEADQFTKASSIGKQAKWLQKYVGTHGIKPVGTIYYKELLNYFDQI